MGTTMTMKLFTSPLSILLSAWLTASATAESPRCLNILLTNDDGYETLYVNTLFEYLRDETCHNILLAAPKGGQSGKSGALSVFEPVEIGNPSPGIYFADTTPLGAALFAMDVVAPENDMVPDLLISGPNEGNNLGYFTAISGTVGATTGAMARDLPAVAVSADADEDEVPAFARMIAQFVGTLVDTIVLLEDGTISIPPGTGLNVNVPPLRVGSGDVNDYDFELTAVGRESTAGGVYFWRDMADSPAQRLLFGGALNGTAGVTGFDFLDDGLYSDPDPASEGNAIGIDRRALLFGTAPPSYVITVSPISYTYARPASASLRRAFEKNTGKSKSGKKSGKKSSKGSKRGGNLD